MTPEQEDALWDKCTEQEKECGIERWRLAIRAAVAQERERAAKVCEETNGSPWHTPTARKLAAAIRKEEKP